MVVEEIHDTRVRLDPVLAFRDTVALVLEYVLLDGDVLARLIRYLLGLREQGLGPDAIVDVMGDDYMLYAYSGDVLSFLDDSVRTLEAVESLADVDERAEAADRARTKRRQLSR